MPKPANTRHLDFVPKGTPTVEEQTARDAVLRERQARAKAVADALEQELREHAGDTPPVPPEGEGATPPPPTENVDPEASGDATEQSAEQ